MEWILGDVYAERLSGLEDKFIHLQFETAYHSTLQLKKAGYFSFVFKPGNV